MTAQGGAPSADEHRGLLERVAEDAHDLVELGLAGDERWRDLDHRVAAVVGPADEPGLEERVREEAPEEALALLRGERLARVLVLDELDRVEEARPAEVADDRELQQLRDGCMKRLLVRAHVLEDALALHDLEVLERDR